MQTKRQIQQLLTSAGVVPNRKFGQHFLVDLNLLKLVVDSAQIGPDDVALEVGCGTGSMTEALAERAGRVVAVELDPTLAAIARSQLAQASNVVLVEGDALSSKGSFNPAVIAAIEEERPIRHDVSMSKKPSRLLLVSNLPYDVASAVIANLVNGPLVADAMVVTVQKEVAQRMAAAPGSRDYGSLSILLGATGDVEILRILKPGVFWPPPQVDSAIVRFARNDQKRNAIEDIALLCEVMGLFIGHRRKMLRACAKHAPAHLGGRDLWTELFEQCGVEPTSRPEELSPDQYIKLANLCRRRLANRRAPI
ncbi:MAG: 16S rRNA (adenine(1518)-N(6)/adenine(1519)-N(6))-dimethyltransferase RsmA [Sedimentisphaerales bacterium]|jgi:16S rRNA (adenine1518-N6/adenine1519-N6)-dimethyltransferase|nr:16S rRNA (adenine(1518)-N(6)/adenine(1519)-N(6))-dimethyltransferase RsmA [Sedimentisphaerales bacterium]HNY77856.1 16S rRNA (adenine(1518)-N(6)/adenine(1519)-N(6))-dimethyltransferase RsmA [Sedimentisphaerales bacterium]HOC63095.1 16S rRNA (adenine(1518)-N(6)/adenine(1519)-N(6))-dimethyltransferase RsmA [Sedimentisphaerales bacterium]HOH64031.1 16S rRNA (adenine(1518)-N(6)/adenine(1519)-N(6))-dimethyltransferase RsmA [Sedimentisphaerales bacterium]HPY48281.1 16S rRNA (adenine(1518)-N(6)/ade